jgi:hypothetical protein
MKVGDLVRCTTNGYRHTVGIVLEYPEQKWNVAKRYIKVMVADDCRVLNWPDNEFEVINESR